MQFRHNAFPPNPPGREGRPSARVVVLVGNPVDGYVFYGPFDGEDAVEAIEHHVKDDAFIAKLHPACELDATKGAA